MTPAELLLLVSVDLSSHELEFGFWPSRRLRGLCPPVVRSPDQYSGAPELNLACTQTDLPPARQRALVREWCALLPTLELTTLEFSSKVSPELFDAACAVRGLEALSVKWSSVRSLEALSQARQLRALFLGSSPAVASLAPLARLPVLKHLFIEGVPGPVDLSFLERLSDLREFGLAAARGRTLPVASLDPVRSLRRLEILWLVRLRIGRDGLRPLHDLPTLASFRSTLRADAPELLALRAAVPSLKYLRPVA